MADEKQLISESETKKIKTHHARIVVDGTAEKPYYSIEWFDPIKKEYFLGYSSYYIRNVFSWLSECFEIVDAPTIEARPVVHGRWIAIGGNHHTRISQCTNCCAKYDFRSKYCPNCGAKMDGDTE